MLTPGDNLQISTNRLPYEQGNGVCGAPTDENLAKFSNFVMRGSRE